MTAIGNCGEFIVIEMLIYLSWLLILCYLLSVFFSVCAWSLVFSHIWLMFGEKLLSTLKQLHTSSMQYPIDFESGVIEYLSC